MRARCPSEHARCHGRWVPLTHADGQRPRTASETEDADMSIDIGKAARFRHHDGNSFPAGGWSR